MKLFSTLVAGVIVAGCATPASNIQAAYVSPLKYDPVECETLRAEALRVREHLASAIATQDQAANHDAAMMAVGMLIAWPALLFIGSKSGDAANVAILKGEWTALEAGIKEKGCEALPPLPVAEPEAEADKKAPVRRSRAGGPR